MPMPQSRAPASCWWWLVLGIWLCLTPAAGAQEPDGEHLRVVGLTVDRAGEAWAITDQSDGLLHSSRGGVSWREVGFTPTGTYFHHLLSDTRAGVWLATSRGLYHGPGPQGPWRLHQPGPMRRLAPDGQDGVWALAWDGGLTHHRSDPAPTGASQPPVTTLPPHTLDLALGPDGHLWAASFTSGLRYSDNQGRSWNPPPQSLASQGVLCLACDDRGGLWAGTLESGLWHTADQGATWARRDGVPATATVTSLLVRPGMILAGTQSRGIHLLSRDSGQGFTTLGEALGHPVQALAALPKGGLLAGTWDGGLLRAASVDTPWRPAHLVLAVGALLMGPDGRVWAGTHAGTLFTSDDRGQTWQAVPPSPALMGQAISSLALGPGDRIYVGTTRRGVFACDARGRDCRALVEGGPQPVESLAVAADGRVWAAGCTRDGGLWSLGAETVWSPAGPPATGCVWRLFRRPDGRLFACTSRGLIHNDDGGSVWLRDEAPVFNWGVLDVARRQDLWVASPGFDFALSRDQGAHWDAPRLDPAFQNLARQHFRRLALADEQTLISAMEYHGVQVWRLEGDQGIRLLGRALEEHRQVHALLALADGVVVAGTSKGLCVTRDRGASWRMVELEP